MYRLEEPIEIDGHRPDTTIVGKADVLYLWRSLIKDEAACIRRWYLPEGREVVGLFYEVAPRENGNGLSLQPGGTHFQHIGERGQGGG